MECVVAQEGLAKQKYLLHVQPSIILDRVSQNTGYAKIGLSHSNFLGNQAGLGLDLELALISKTLPNFLTYLERMCPILANPILTQDSDPDHSHL